MTQMNRKRPSFRGSFAALLKHLEPNKKLNTNAKEYVPRSQICDELLLLEATDQRSRDTLVYTEVIEAKEKFFD